MIAMLAERSISYYCFLKCLFRSKTILFLAFSVHDMLSYVSLRITVSFQALWTEKYIEDSILALQLYFVLAQGIRCLYYIGTFRTEVFRRVVAT